MRLIDADAILPKDYDFENKFIVGIRGSKFAHLCLTFLRQMIAEAPTVDAVKVVRCFECANHCDTEGEHYCKFWRMYCPDDSEFYCKAGVKK